MLSKFFSYPSTIVSSAIYAYIVQISDEATASGIFSCDRAKSVWRLLLSSAVFNRWRVRDSQFHATCLSVWAAVMDSREVETLDSHADGKFVMTEMFELCLASIDDIDYSLLPENDSEESPYWACLNYIRLENIRFCARLN